MQDYTGPYDHIHSLVCCNLQVVRNSYTNLSRPAEGMQYFSGVWQSLTGHSIVKRKRSEDETAALPDRMTSLKLHADQNPGTYHRATSSANHPARSCDVDSSIASGSHFQASDCCLHNSNSSFNQYNQNSLLDHAHSSQFPATGLWTHAIPQSAGARTTASYTASLGNTVNLQQGSLSNDAIPHSMYTQVPAESSQHTGLRPYRLAAPKQTSSNTQQQTSNTQHQQLTTRSTAHPLPEATAEADLHSLESFSPVDRHDIPSQPSLYSPDMALSESVADSPDDIELLEDEVMQTNSPFAKHSTATAFLAVCQSPQVITALSKLHACKDLPSGCIMLPLPTSAQHCGIAMASELSSAASAQASWNTASQLAWTIAAMFALCQRAKLCEQELDAMMLLSILWILGKQLQSFLTMNLI